MPQTLTITRHAIRNYGSVLQACATQTLIEAAGSSCTTIDYRQPGVGDTARGYRLRPPGPVGLVKDLTYRAFRARGARARGRVFEKFLKERLQLTPDRFDSYEALASHRWPEDSIYCVGSDQVWNLETNADNRPYYLSFAPRVAKRFSFASSIGMSRLPSAAERRLVDELSVFAGVSVRELDAAAYLRSLGIAARCHLDPALAVTGRQWREFASAIPPRRGNYVLVYQLNSNPTLQEAAIAVGKELDLPVVRLEYWQTFRGRGAHTLMRPSVEEFVALIRDACVLVSDSFHGAAFALNLDTLLVSIRPPTYRGRLDSLLSQFELEALRASSVDQAVQIVREHGTLPDRAARLAKEQAKAREYLAEMLDHRNTATEPHGTRA